MIIAFDAKRAFANRRGLGNYSRDVIRLMRTYAPENDYVLFGSPSDAYEPGAARVVSPKGLWRCFPSLWRTCGCLNSLDGIDIYHGLSGELPFGIHRKEVKTVVTVHDAIFMRYPELYSATYRWLFARKVQYACDHADLIIAISEQTKRDIIEFFHADERKIHVVYQGCNNRFREPVSEARLAAVRKQYRLPEQFILSVGAIEPRKNLKNLIEAMSMAHIDLPLVAVGARVSMPNRWHRSPKNVRSICGIYMPSLLKTCRPYIRPRRCSAIPVSSKDSVSRSWRPCASERLF